LVSISLWLSIVFPVGIIFMSVIGISVDAPVMILTSITDPAGKE
jgi:hypothetical protein